MFETLKNYREVGDFDVLSPTLDDHGYFSKDLLSQAIQERVQAKCRHLGLEITQIELLNQPIMEVLWFYLQDESKQKPGSFAILGNAQIKEAFTPFLSLKGFLFFNSEAEMISWSLVHHDDETEITPIEKPAPEVAKEFSVTERPIDKPFFPNENPTKVDEAPIIRDSRASKHKSLRKIETNKRILILSIIFVSLLLYYFFSTWAP